MSEAGAQQAVKPTQSMRWLAAGWFAGFAFLAMGLMFLGRPMARPGVILFLLMPAVAGAIAGYLLGGAIPDPRESYGLAMLRGLGVTAGALVIFAALFTIALPLAEPRSHTNSVVGFFLGTILFGTLFAGPISIVSGLIASATLHAVGGRLWRELKVS